MTSLNQSNYRNRDIWQEFRRRNVQDHQLRCMYINMYEYVTFKSWLLFANVFSDRHWYMLYSNVVCFCSLLLFGMFFVLFCPVSFSSSYIEFSACLSIHLLASVLCQKRNIPHAGKQQLANCNILFTQTVRFLSLMCSLNIRLKLIPWHLKSVVLVQWFLF